MSPKLFKLLPALLWMLLIWTLSSIPAQDVPSVKIWSFDKVAHFTIYFILGLLINRYLSYGKIGIKKTLLLYVILLLSAGLDEWHQHYIPGRSVTIYDFLANATGLIVAFFLYNRRHLKAAT